jgi:hypothetical protein
MGRMPLYFKGNRGQMDPRAPYYVQGRDTTLYFTAEGLYPAVFVNAGYISGGGYDEGVGIAVDSSCKANVAGS